MVSPRQVVAAGTWHPLANLAPGGSIESLLLLTDGTVICGNSGTSWYKLTPNSSGSYINGTWSTIASMNYSRLYFGSQVLTNGEVFVVGAEYGSGSTNSEIYNPVANTWTKTTVQDEPYEDCITKMLPSGNVLVGPAWSQTSWIYNPTLDSWTQGGSPLGSQNETDWVTLPDGSIMGINLSSTNVERYIPSLNKWIKDAPAPVKLYVGGEMGAGHLLPNGKVFWIGGTTNTAIYTPSGTTNVGTWAAGPSIPNNLGAMDAASAMEFNGDIIMALNTSDELSGPTYFYEYDYTANTLTQISGPTNTTENIPCYLTTMLELPTGGILYANNSKQLYIYSPSGTAVSKGTPGISSVTLNSDGSYTLTGTNLCGISEGAKYGDDKQMDSNYPIVQLVNGSNKYFAKTFCWPPGKVQTGTTVLSTKFTLPAGLPSGTYSLYVIANGISSAAYSFTH